MKGGRQPQRGVVTLVPRDPKQKRKKNTLNHPPLLPATTVCASQASGDTGRAGGRSGTGAHETNLPIRKRTGRGPTPAAATHRHGGGQTRAGGRDGAGRRRGRTPSCATDGRPVGGRPFRRFGGRPNRIGSPRRLSTGGTDPRSRRLVGGWPAGPFHLESQPHTASQCGRPVGLSSPNGG